jgi:ketosteroid isomerase-like protein
MDTHAIVREVLRLWATQDVESTFAYVADDVVYSLNIDEDLAPFAGVTHGREGMIAAFYQMIEQYDYLDWKQVIVGVEGNVARVQTQFRLHHRRTGTNLEGSMRTVITMGDDGMMIRCEEFLDRGLVESFMRLAQHREATNQIVKPPEIPGRRPMRDDGRSPRMSTDEAQEESVEAPDKESVKVSEAGGD